MFIYGGKMYRRVLYFCLFLALVCAVVPVIAAADSEEYPDRKNIGSWMLDRVYEDASGPEPTELHPETAASVYAEKNNIYTFVNENNAFFVTIHEGGESFTESCTWEEDGSRFTIRNEDGIYMELFYDEDTGKMHRYWGEPAADFMYHDLDFVYVRVPFGYWVLHAVYSICGDEKILLDPENAASVYAEKNNKYKLSEDGTAVEIVPDADSMEGVWEKVADSYLFRVGGFEMEFVFDAKNNVLHRYWVADQEDSMYTNLDFVYYPMDIP